MRRFAVFLALLFTSSFAGAENLALHGHGGPVKSIAVSQDGGRALSGSFDYSLIYWDISGKTPEILARFTDHDAAVNSVAFLPGGEKALSASDDGTVGLWDLRSKKLIKRFTGHSHKVVKIAVSGDGALAVSAAWDRTARIWDLRNMKPGPVLKGHSNSINDAAFSDDGRFVFTAGYDGTIRQWNVSDGTFERMVYKHGWGVNVAGILPGGTELIFGTVDGFVGILDIASGEVGTILKPHKRPVLSLAINARLNMAATGGGDGRITVWDMKSWGAKFNHENPYGPVWGLEFAHNGKDMFYASLDDNVHHWQMQPAKPFELAKGVLPRRFQLREGIGLGARQFARKCSVCHTLTPDGAHRAGPTLYKVFGRKAGAIKGYSYSPALTQTSIVWGDDTIEQLFARGPDKYLPGTKMPLQKMTNAEERKALISFLKKASETGKPAEDAYARFGQAEDSGETQ